MKITKQTATAITKRIAYVEKKLQFTTSQTEAVAMIKAETAAYLKRVAAKCLEIGCDQGRLIAAIDATKVAQNGFVDAMCVDLCEGVSIPEIEAFVDASR